MRRLGMVAFAFAFLLLAARLAAAKQQEPPPLPATRVVMPASALQTGPLSTEQQRELEKWLDAVIAWQREEKHSQNGPTHNSYGKIVQRKISRFRLDGCPRYCTSDRGNPHRFARAEDRARMRRPQATLRGS